MPAIELLSADDLTHPIEHIMLTDGDSTDDDEDGFLQLMMMAEAYSAPSMRSERCDMQRDNGEAWRRGLRRTNVNFKRRMRRHDKRLRKEQCCRRITLDETELASARAIPTEKTTSTAFQGTSTKVGQTVKNDRCRLRRVRARAPLIGSTNAKVIVLRGVTDGLKNAMSSGPAQGRHLRNRSVSCWSTCGNALEPVENAEGAAGEKACNSPLLTEKSSLNLL